MACLIDTGILLRAFDADFAEYHLVRGSLRKLLVRGERMVVAVQNLAEFWNTSTRPVECNGYGLTIERVNRRIRWIEQLCEVVTEDDASFRAWKILLTTHSVTGVAVHDARLVSVMLARGISAILTLNQRDFRRYPGLTVITPDTL